MRGCGAHGGLCALMWCLLSTAAAVAGSSGGGLAFGGSRDYVTMGVAPGLGAETFTLECWFKRTGTGATASSGSGGVSGVPLLCKGRGEADGNNRDCNYFFCIRGGDGVLAADFEDTTSGLNHPVAGVTPVQNDVWYHAAVTYDGTTWRIYLDGVLETTLVANATPRFDSIQHFALGSALTSTGSAAGFFAGEMDEARVWNIARTQQQIQKGMNVQIPIAEHLVGRWSMNEGAGTTANDSTGNGNAGTLIGDVSWGPGVELPETLEVRTVSPTDVDADGATLRGELLALGADTSVDVRFRYGTDPENLDQMTSVQTRTAPGSFSAIVSGLNTGTPYFCQATADGTSADTAGGVVQFYATDNPGLRFDGVNDHVTMGVAPSLSLATFTLECWFYWDGTGVSVSSGSGGVSTYPLIAKGRGEADGSNVDCNYFFGIIPGSGVLAADFEDFAAGLNHPVIGTTPVSTNVWHHAAATYDGSVWRLYLDGSIDAELSANATPRFDSVQHFGIGSALNSVGTAAGAFGGAIDEVRVWGAARSQSEIVSTINAELANPVAGLAGRWGMDEASGTTIGDSTTNNKIGSIVGATWTEGAPFDLIVPLGVTTLGADDITPTGATLQGALTAFGNESSADVFFRYGTHPDQLDQTTPTQTLSALGNFEASLAKLVPDTVYYYQAVAQGQSQTAEGAVLSFFAADRFGLELDGTGDYVTMGASPSLGLDAFTLECWFKRTGDGVTASSGAGGVVGVPLICKGRGETDGSNVDCNYFFAIAGNTLAADFEDFANGSNHPVTGSLPIEEGRWYHAAVTYDGSTWRLYLNGVLDAELTVDATPRFDSIQHFGVGTALNSIGATEGRFAGVIDEVRVWNVVRTQQELRDGASVEIESAPNLVARWGFNEGTGTVAVDSSGSTKDGTVVGGVWTIGAPFAINFAPDAPLLVAPPTGSIQPAGAVSLEVEVNDPEADALTVEFWGRRLGRNTADPFTFIALPDTQFYSERFPAFFNAQTQWIVNNRDALNIKYVMHLGDIVQTATVIPQWVNADTAMSIVDLLPDLPYGLTVGNHDQAGNPTATTNYNLFFPYSRYMGVSPWYGGHHGNDNDNSYLLFSAGGMDFIAIHFEYDTSPEQPVLDWADSLLKTHADRRGIVVTHHLVNTGNPANFSTQGAAIYQALKENPNLFLMHGGHVIGEGRREDTFNGNKIYSLLADYQGRPNGGDGWLRIYEFRPADNLIRVQTYSPTLDRFEVDANSQFSLDYDMSGTNFELLGTVENATSGATATFAWEGLEDGFSYEWFARVNDGGSDTQSTTWTFTTTTLVGDMNCDGTVSVGDINGFVLALTDPDAYALQFPDCDALNADCTDDGQVTVGDINCFVALVTGG